MKTHLRERFAAISGRWLLVFVFLLAFATRVYRLGSQSLWADEAESVAVSSWPLVSLITEHTGDVHPPLHYLLLHFLMPLAGRSEFAVRYLSLVFGVLLVPLLYLVGKMLAGERVGRIVALLAAMSPFYVRFAQEARMYTLAIFLSLLSTYFFLKIALAGERDRPTERTEQTDRDNVGASRPNLPKQLSAGALGVNVGYVTATAAALYSHYFTVFVIIVQMTYVLGAWWRHRTPIKPWLWRLLVVGLIYLPWLILMVYGEPGIYPALRTSSEASGPNAPVSGLIAALLEGRAGMVSLPAILKQCLISFGPSDFIELQYATWLAAALALLALAGLLGHSIPAKPWKYWLLLYFLLPPILGYLIGFPAKHPLWAKYFGVASPAYYLLLGLGLAACATQKRGRAVGAAFAAGVIGMSIFGLRNYYFDANYGRYDYRPQIRYLEAFSLPTDALLINPSSHFPTFWHYYGGGRVEAETDPGVYFPLEWTGAEAELTAIAAHHSGVWVVKNMPNDFDADGEIESWLARHAYPTTTIWAGNTILRFYSLAAPTAVGQVDILSYGESPPLFGTQIALSGYRIASQLHNYSQILQLTLFWQAIEPINESYVVYAHLVDEKGRTWGQIDTPPAGGFNPTDEWTPGEPVEDRLGLLALPGTPPGKYWVKLGLYRADNGQRLPVSGPRDEDHPVSGSAPADLMVASDGLLLGPIHLERVEAPPPIEALGITRSLEGTARLGDLELLGYDLNADPIKPGDTIPLILFWRARAEIDRDYQVILHLDDKNGQHRAESREGVTGGEYPLPRWVAGEVVREPRELVVDNKASPGSYDLIATLVDPATNAELDASTIGTLSIRDRNREFTMPPIPNALQANLGDKVSLLGYDLTNEQREEKRQEVAKIEVKPGDSLRLTLFWRCLSPMEVSYTVFTHLLGGDSVIWGQHDSVPGKGSLPTTGCAVDEVIIDEYRISIKPDAPAGEYVIEVGMYNADTGQRLPVLPPVGEGMSDRVLLPTQVFVR